MTEDILCATKAVQNTRNGLAYVHDSMLYADLLTAFDNGYMAKELFLETRSMR